MISTLPFVASVIVIFLDRGPRAFPAAKLDALAGLARLGAALVDLARRADATEETRAALGDAITDREHAERRLRESAAQNHAILENAGEGIVTVTEDGLVESFDRAAARTFGWSESEIVGRRFGTLLAEPDRSRLEGLFAGDSQGAAHEVVGLRKDGVTFPLELALATASVGGRRLAIAVTRDVSERKAIERLKSEFVAAVSHELRTPLTSIRGSLRLLEGG